MNLSDIIGSWSLVNFQITNPQGITRNWGENVSGLLIYTTEKTMSVSINKSVLDPKNLQNQMDSILFYAGNYELEQDIISHQVTNASDPARIGKVMVRKAIFKNPILTLEAEGDFGYARISWKRI